MDRLLDWPPRRWLAALLGALGVALAVGLPTDVIPNPVFGREIEVTWWSYPILVLTAVLGGLLIATYVRVPDPASPTPDVGVQVAAGAAVDVELDRPSRLGGLGGFLSFFAVGCPTCNKLVVIALGSTGALDWFAPAQPILAVASIVLLAWALRSRLRGEVECALPPRPA